MTTYGKTSQLRRVSLIVWHRSVIYQKIGSVNFIRIKVLYFLSIQLQSSSLLVIIKDNNYYKYVKKLSSYIYVIIEVDERKTYNTGVGIFLSRVALTWSKDQCNGFSWIFGVRSEGIFFKYCHDDTMMRTFAMTLPVNDKMFAILKRYYLFARC